MVKLVPKSNSPFGRAGHYSPLRYPGGKGKIARFIKEIILQNDLSGGHYVEPYAGGAAVAWEMLINGIVSRVSINDINKPVYAFWNSVLNDTDNLCRLIYDCKVTVAQWDLQKSIYKQQDKVDELELAFAFFFLNRTNRSGILNAGFIGGRHQLGQWKIDARFKKEILIRKIEKIASLKNKIKLTKIDAIKFLEKKSKIWKKNVLVYIDPPYFAKGKVLYHDSYEPADHADVAKAVRKLKNINWIVSYDDVEVIHELYEKSKWLQYTLSYSAAKKIRGKEAMFFSKKLIVPKLPHPLLEVDKDLTARPRPVNKRIFATA